MRRATILLLTTLVLGVPAAARAEGDVDVSASVVVTQLKQMAVEYWGAEACPAGYTVVVGEVLDFEPNGERAGAEASEPGCFTRIGANVWHDHLAADRRSTALCALFVHEYGHSLGHAHTTDPLSVMSPGTLYTTGLPPVCSEVLDGAWIGFASTTVVEDAAPAERRHASAKLTAKKARVRRARKRGRR